MNKIATILAVAVVSFAFSASSANAQKNVHVIVSAPQQQQTPIRTHGGIINNNSNTSYTVRGQWHTRGSNGIQHQLTLDGFGFKLDKVSRTQGTVRQRGGSWKSSPIQNRQFTLKLNYRNGQTETLSGVFGPRGNAIKLTSQIDGSVWILKRR